MTDSITINHSRPDSDIYISLLPQIEALINPNEQLISNLANITAALKEAFHKISWVGFYIYKDGKLFLGPFQGKVACTIIDIGKGVCGSSAASKKTIIVDDVDKFPGHIACDSDSRSEIVIPLIIENKILGVLDLDSYNQAAFNDTDKKYLEILCDLLTKKLAFGKSTL